MRRLGCLLQLIAVLALMAIGLIATDNQDFAARVWAEIRSLF
jgi:hypothetical protein